MQSSIKPEGKQNEVLALPAKGHTVVLGTAGSGKTTMALFRAMHLANLPSKSNVLVVTFNRALVQYMSTICNMHMPNLRIENYHKFAMGYLHSLGKMPGRNGVVGPKAKERYINQALEKVRNEYPTESTFRRSVSVFMDEIIFMQRFGITNIEEYMTAERIGRSSANIRRENRKWFFMIYEYYLDLRRNDDFQYDWDDMASFVYKELQTDSRARLYNHIIVDEGQDFSPMMIKSLISAVDTAGSFSFFGDVAQQIYGSRLSWRDSGININDNGIWRFDKNYRNPAIISLFAKDITNSKYWTKSNDMITPTSFIAQGPKPVLIKFDNEQNEAKWLIKQIKTSALTASNVIVCRNRSIIYSLDQYLKNSGISTTIINKNQAGLASVKGVYLSTFHSVKGLEFENVFIPFLSNEYFPDKEILKSATSTENALFDEIKLLYVAVTRSKFGLFMSYHGELSMLFPETSSNYDIANGGNV